MAKKTSADLKVAPEQTRYAIILEKGMLVGLVILMLTFTIYVLGIMKPYIPLDQVSHYWSMNVDDYLHHTNIKGGWSWVTMLGYGDFLNFIGIAILAGVTIICYASIVPIFFKNKDMIYAIFAILEILILSLAASGLLTVGH